MTLLPDHWCSEPKQEFCNKSFVSQYFSIIWQVKLFYPNFCSRWKVILHIFSMLMMNVCVCVCVHIQVIVEQEVDVWCQLYVHFHLVVKIKTNLCCDYRFTFVGVDCNDLDDWCTSPLVCFWSVCRNIKEKKIF